MFPWQDLIQLIIARTISVYFDFMYWIVLALVGYQYWTMQRNQKRMFGVCSYSLRQQVLLTLFYGTLGGIVGSVLLTVVGVTLNQMGFNYIWPLALLLMMVSVRFLCFAYAGGIVALGKILFNWPADVNVPQILTLVAVLHITESLLIAISGRYSASPLILRRGDGRLVGAFSLQNFWPLPLVLLMAVAVPGSDLPAGTMHIGDWWPLLPLGIEIPEGQRWVYALTPVVAALGYTDMAITSSPLRRRMETACHLAVYSATLLALALLSAKYEWLQVFAALLCPLGHELLIQLDNRRETEGEPRYVPPNHGVMILDTVLDTPARQLGLKPGDILLSLDGRPVNCGADLGTAILYAPQEFPLVIERDGRRLKKKSRWHTQGDERRLGVILVPEGHEQVYAEMATERFAIWEWLKGLRRK
ncbi:MAG: PDZ domain-containing protein [Veillonellales bacterium]